MSTPMPRGINENDVWKAADALLLEGARPTIERVRQKIGRGSPNTVTPYLETWFRSLGARIADPMAFAAPPALPDPISEAAKHFWEAALAAARAEGAAALDAERTNLTAASRQLDVERAQLRTDLDRIQAQLQAKEEAAQLLRDHLTESQQRVQALSGELEAQDQTLVALRSQIAKIDRDRDALRQHFDAERGRLEASRQDWEARETAHAERWAQEVDRARQAAQSAQVRVAQMDKECSSRIDTLNRNLAQVNDQKRELAELLARAETELTTLRSTREADSREISAQRERHNQRESELRVRTERLESQLSEVLEQLNRKETEHGGLLRKLMERQESTQDMVVGKTKRRRRAGS